jgi:hypothetical protein
MGIPLTREFTSADRFTCDSCLSLSSLPPNVFPLPRRDRRKEKAKEEERRRKRERVRQEKKRGLTKEQRAAIRSKERLARRKEREVNQAKTTAKATKDGLKNLLAQFDDDYSSESSSEEESSEEDSPPPPPKATKKPLTAKPGGSSAAVAGKAGVPASPSNAKVAHAPPRKPVIASLDSIRKKVCRTHHHRTILLAHTLRALDRRKARRWISQWTTYTRHQNDVSMR